MTTRIRITNETDSDQPENHRVRVKHVQPDRIVTASSPNLTQFEAGAVLLDRILEEGESVDLSVWSGTKVTATEE